MAENKIYFQAQPLLPIDDRLRANNVAKYKSAGNDFDKLLNEKLDCLKFSQHALDRLQSRNLQLSEADLKRLSQAVDKAAQKGAKESLVMMNDIALVVSVKNRTVITAMDGNGAEDKIITNIDSAVIL